MPIHDVVACTTGSDEATRAPARRVASPRSTHRRRHHRCASAGLLVALIGSSWVPASAASAPELAAEAHRASADVALASITLREAWSGSADAYSELAARCKAVATAPERLATAIPKVVEWAKVATLRRDVGRLADRLRTWARDCAYFADLRDPLLAAYETSTDFEASVPMQALLLDRVAANMRERGDSTGQLYFVMRQFALQGRIETRIRKVLDAGPEAPTAQESIGRDAAMYLRILDALIDGNPQLGIQRIADVDAVADLRSLREQFRPVADRLAALLSGLDLADTGDRLESMAAERELLVGDLRELATRAGVDGP